MQRGDLNNDGLADLYFTGNQVGDKLYKNLGDFKFEDKSLSAEVATNSGWRTGVTMVDINQDGLLDIYICKGGLSSKGNENVLFINKGDFKFENEARYYGLDDAGYSTHANFFDADNDGDLDVYILNRPEKWQQNTDSILKKSKNPPPGTSDILYINEGGNYKNANIVSGIGNNYAYSLSSSTIDINNDGLLDIYVANDFLSNDLLYVNQGDGKFEESIREHTNHNSFYAMGSDAQDINNDGFEDLFVVEMLPQNYFDAKVKMVQMFGDDRFDQLFNMGKFHHQYMHNTLNLNTGSGFMTDISSYAGLKKTDWSWACLLADFNSDGLRDVFVANGYKRDVYDRDNSPKFKDTVQALLVKSKTASAPLPSLKNILDHLLPTQKTANNLFVNKGNLKFEDIRSEWGMNEKSLSNGAAIADLDNDGDLDLVVNNIDEPAFIYRNDIAGQRSIRIKLNGPKGNRNGIGALIEVNTTSTKMVERFKVVRGYLSSVEPIAHFGIPTGEEIVEVKVKWLDNKVSELREWRLNEVNIINYEGAENPKDKEVNESLFTDVTDKLIKDKWEHKENYFRDYVKQVLLPHRQSMHGPALSVGDVNGDGLDDFFIGGAYNETGALFIQRSDGTFYIKKSALLDKDNMYEDVGADFLDIDADGDQDLYVVSGGMEYDLNSNGYQDRLYVNDGKGNFVSKFDVPDMNISGSVATSFDMDGDKKEEIFVGGRHFPHYYPKPVHSMLLRNQDDILMNLSGHFIDNLEFLGMVTDATWTDLNGDKFPELVVVGEWMPITVFAMENGKMRNYTSALGMNKTNGWWFSVNHADLDGDGDQDLICGNIGLNYKFKASLEKPFEVFADDFDDNGSFDIFLSKKLKDNRLVPIRGRDCTSEQMPIVAERFPTFRDFAKGDIYSLLDNDTTNALHLKAFDFASVIIENVDGKFKRHQLPALAQMSAIRGIVCR